MSEKSVEVVELGGTEAYMLRHLDQLSRDWVDQVARVLETQGRRMEGGWPGTMSEARVRIQQSSSCIAQPLFPKEQDRLARGLCERAKSIWLANAKLR